MRGATEVWMYGVLEERCKRGDVDVWRYGCMELWSGAVGVQTRKHGGTEV